MNLFFRKSLINLHYLGTFFKKKDKIMSKSKKEKIKIPKSFLSLCYHISRLYDVLDNGTYSSYDQKYFIEKIEFSDKNKPIKISPEPNCIQINSYITGHYSFSGVLFILVWCFINKFFENESEADLKTFKILKDIPEFDRSDAITDFTKIMSYNISEDALKRISTIIKES